MNHYEETLTAILHAIEVLSKKVDCIDEKVNRLISLTSGSGSVEKCHEMTPGDSHLRNNRSILTNRLNLFIPSDKSTNKSTRKKLSFKCMKFDGETPKMETITSTLNENTLDSVLLPDPLLTTSYEDVCKHLQVVESKPKLSKISLQAAKLLRSLEKEKEKIIQSQLSSWLSSDQCKAIDTSESPLELPLFKFAENGVATATGKPDATCLVMPLKLEIKDTAGNHGTALIDKEYDLLSQMIERVQTEVGHNELVKRSICFGTSGRYAWLMLLEGNLLNTNLSGTESHPCLEQTLSLLKIEVDDIVPLWEQLVATKSKDLSYYLDQAYYWPVARLLSSYNWNPAWTRIRVAERGSNSVIFHCHLSDHHAVAVDQPDLCIKVFPNSVQEVQILHSILTKTQTNPDTSPVRYVLATLTATPYQVTEFFDRQTVMPPSLRDRRVPSLPSFASLTAEHLWWNTPGLRYYRNCSAILMHYGVIYRGPLDRIKEPLKKCLRRVHDCGYLHTDIRTRNWLVFPQLLPPPSRTEIEAVAAKSDGVAAESKKEDEDFVMGIPLLIDYDQAVEMTKPDQTMVMTKPGARREVMLRIVLKANEGNKDQLIHWSVDSDLELLSNMLQQYAQSPPPQTPRSLILSFHNLSHPSVDSPVQQQLIPEMESLQVEDITPIISKNNESKR